MNLIQSILSRRNMLAGLAGSAALVGGISSAEASQRPGDSAKRPLGEPLEERPSAPANGPLANATVDDWASHVGSKFETSTGHTLRLAEVKEFADQNRRPSGLRARPFVAQFDVVAGNRPLPEELTLRVDHKVGGSFDLFLSTGGPVRPDRRIAVFS